VRDTALFVADEIQGTGHDLLQGSGRARDRGPASAQGAARRGPPGHAAPRRHGGRRPPDRGRIDPGNLVLLATVAAPSIEGVVQQGQTGIALLGDGGAMAVDLRTPSAPLVRGMIPVPGFSHDAAWSGDTLLVAESFALERFSASPRLPWIGAEPERRPGVGPSARPESSGSPRSRRGDRMEPHAIYRHRRAGGHAQVNESLLGPLVHAALDGGSREARPSLPAGGFFPDDPRSRWPRARSTSLPTRPWAGSIPTRTGRGPARSSRFLSRALHRWGKSIELRVFDLGGRLVRRIQKRHGGRRRIRLPGLGRPGRPGTSRRGRCLLHPPVGTGESTMDASSFFFARSRRAFGAGAPRRGPEHVWNGARPVPESRLSHPARGAHPGDQPRPSAVLGGTPRSSWRDGEADGSVFGLPDEPERAPLRAHRRRGITRPTKCASSSFARKGDGR